MDADYFNCGCKSNGDVAWSFDCLVVFSRRPTFENRIKFGQSEIVSEYHLQYQKASGVQIAKLQLKLKLHAVR